MVTPTAAGLITNTLTVSSPTPDPNPANNSVVTLTTVYAAPGIVTPPASQTVNAGGNVSFQVAATGTAPLSYQWQFSGSNIAGATSTSLMLNNVQATNAGNYAVVVTNSLGSVTSAVAVLTVQLPPAITSQPQNQTVTSGNPASFTVVAVGTSPFAYQWNKNGINVSGATNATYGITAASTNDAGNYAVVVINIAGAITSSVAKLTVYVPPVPMPVVVSNSFTLVAEACTNGAIDPAETVTVNFGLQNTGTAPTTNLVATLLATGGVLAPSGPQNYGVLNTNGPAVVQPFTFTASGSCGGTNIASLQLQDGAVNLGM